MDNVKVMFRDCNDNIVPTSTTSISASCGWWGAVPPLEGLLYPYIWPTTTTTSGYISVTPNVLKANIFDSTETYEIDVDVPGVKNSGIEVTIDAQILSIKAVLNACRGIGDRSVGEHSRLFILPQDVIVSSCEARLVEGLLTISFRKLAETVRKIEVK